MAVHSGGSGRVVAGLARDAGAMGRLLLAGLLGAALLTPLVEASVRPPSPPLIRSASEAPVLAYVPPLAGGLRVLRRFDPPATLYGPGHLGVDLAAAAGTEVRSAGPGVVTFAGPVAGRGVLVVAHPDGIRTEYEPVRALVRRGAAVRAGQPVGVVAGPHPGCRAVSCLHWGARRGVAYLDPLALLRPLAPVRLLPWPAGG